MRVNEQQYPVLRSHLDLRSDAAPSPVFLNHDDDEGFSEYLAPSVREWFAREVTRVIRSMGEEDD